MTWSELPEWQKRYLEALHRGDDAAARVFESPHFLRERLPLEGNVVSFIALQRAHRNVNWRLEVDGDAALTEAGTLVECAVASGFERAGARIFRRFPTSRRAVRDGNIDEEVVEQLLAQPSRNLAPSRSAHGFALKVGPTNSASVRRTLNRLGLRTTRVTLPRTAPSSAEELFDVLDVFSGGRNRLHMSALVMEWDEAHFPLAVQLGRTLLMPLIVVDHSPSGGTAVEYAREHAGELFGAGQDAWWTPVMSVETMLVHGGGPVIRELSTDVKLASHQASGITSATELALRLGWVLRDGFDYAPFGHQQDSGLETVPFRWFGAEITRRRKTGVFGDRLVAVVAEFLWNQPLEGSFRRLRKRCELWSLTATVQQRRALLRTARHCGADHYVTLVRGARMADAREYRRAGETLAETAAQGHLSARYLWEECRAAADLTDELDRGLAVRDEATVANLTDELDRGLAVHDEAAVDRPEKVVCIMHASVPYQSGGYAIRAHGILRELTEEGVDVSAVTRPGYPAETDDGEYRPENVVDGVHYLHIESSRVNREVSEARHIASFVEDFVDVLRRTGATKVHVRSTFLIAVPAIIAARRLGLKIVYEISGLWELVYAEREPRDSLLRKAPMAEHFEILAARHADYVVVMNEAVRQLTVERGVPEEHIRLVPNAVDAHKFVPRSGRPGSVIGFIGSFVDYEGIELIVRAAAQLLARGFEVQVHLVGDGPEHSRVSRLVEQLGLVDRVTMTGRVPHDQVILEYEKIDIMVYPRLVTAATTTITPLKPFEALAMEKAVVVSDVPPLREIAGDGTRALIFPAGETSGLVEALERLIVDEDLRCQLGRRGREWVARERSWKQVGETFREVYSHL